MSVQTPDASPSIAAAAEEAALDKLVPGCAWCSNTTFWKSRLRSADWPELLQLRLPVRCRRCSHRQFVSLRTRFGANSIRPQTPRSQQR